MRLDVIQIPGFDGTPLSVRRALPDQGLPKRSLLWIHGLSEHGGRYDHVLEHWTRRGWQIVLPDHRGHGLSGGTRSDVASFVDYLRDLQIIWHANDFLDQRAALFGHSMGGLLAIRAVQTGLLHPAAVALSSPLLGVRIPVPRWKTLLGRILVCCAPRTRFKTHISPQNMTRDANFLQRRLSDPLIQRTVTARWFFAMQKALTAAHRDAAKFDRPVLALQGGEDQTVDPTAVEPWLAKTSSTDREFAICPHNVHELLNDAGWEAIADRIADWLEPRTPVISSRLDS
jgi:lysophospholipase